MSSLPMYNHHCATLGFFGFYRLNIYGGRYLTLPYKKKFEYLAISIVLVLLKEQYLADWYMLHVQLMSPAALNPFTTMFSGEGSLGTALSCAKYHNLTLLSPVVLVSQTRPSARLSCVGTGTKQRIRSMQRQKYGVNSLRMRITKLLDGFILAVVSQTANTAKYNSSLNIILIRYVCGKPHILRVLPVALNLWSYM